MITNETRHMSQMKRQREAAGMTQSQLAALTGINIRMIQHYEQGQKNLDGAHLNTLLRLCLALHCPLAALVTDQETLSLIGRYNEQQT